MILGQVSLSETQISKLDSITTQDIPKDAPGIATAIISNGKVIYQNFAGYGSLEDSLKINSHTRFNLASNGKQFTALAILQLQEQGKLKLSDDIRDYFPELLKDVESKISIENLLQHTSGIRDVYDLWSLKGITWWKHTYTNEDAINLLRSQKDVNFTPGSNYLYSNSNYILLAQLIEKVSGRSFVNFTKEMFVKLNMNATSFEDDFTAIREPIAKAYFNFDVWSNYKWKWNVVGDGNLFSTLSDQIEWEKIVQGYGKTKINREIIVESQRLLHNGDNFKYGYGIEHADYKGLSYKYHEGATGAWKATLLRFDPNISLITMTNSGKTIPSIQTRQMADVIFNLKDDSKNITKAPTQSGKYVSDDEILGVYLTSSNFSFEFRKKENGDITLDRIGRGELLIVRESSNIFHQKYDPAFKQVFTKNEKGEMIVTAYYTSHAPYSLTRVQSDWTNYNYNKINGSYSNDEIGVQITIDHKNDKNYDVILNGKGKKGILVTPSKMLINNYVIEFTHDKDNIPAFKLSSDRIKNINFIRKL